jgi:iron complex transport system substrate-binding protein
MKKLSTLILLFTFLLTLFSGCTRSTKQQAASQQAVLQQIDRTVIDQAGRTVVVSGTVERIVSGYYISTSALIALGLADKLVGIEARAASRPVYTLTAPILLELPNVGTAREFNMEACIALHPDLVILPIRLRSSAEILEELGIPVLLVDPESPEEIISMISLIGNAANAEQRANILIEYYKRSLEEINLLTLRIVERPVVYMGGVGSYLTTAPRDMYQSKLIKLAGGANPNIDGNSWTAISYEQFLAINPDVIVIPSEAVYNIEDIARDPQLVNLSAVRSGMIYKMLANFEAWDSPVPSFTLGIRWLLSVLHEDVYPMESMREYAATFYSRFYGIEIDTGLIKG